MSKALKITGRLFLVMGFILLSFKPSTSKYFPPSLIHPHHIAFSKFESLSKRVPTSHSSSDLRGSFQRNEDKRWLNVAVVAVPNADVFAFNVPSFRLGTSASSFPSVISPLETVVLRI
jgi:hypothetical protein